MLRHPRAGFEAPEIGKALGLVSTYSVGSSGGFLLRSGIQCHLLEEPGAHRTQYRPGSAQTRGRSASKITRFAPVCSVTELRRQAKVLECDTHAADGRPTTVLSNALCAGVGVLGRRRGTPQEREERRHAGQVLELIWAMTGMLNAYSFE